MKTLITKKLGMTSTISDNGIVQAVTLLLAQPNIITQIKTAETDGYTAVQLGFEQQKNGNSKKPQAGHFAKSSDKLMPKVVCEFRTENTEEDLKVGEHINPEVFSVGDVVTVTGTSKGKGWAGTIKRHNFHRQPKTHGGKGDTRKPGSIGSMFPQKIFKGKKMAGQMGNERVTVKNLTIAFVDSELGVIGVNGAVPGPQKSIVLLKGSK